MPRDYAFVCRARLSDVHTVMLTAALVAALATGSFADRLWRAMPTDRGNVVVSPTSLDAALGLLAHGLGPSSKPALAATLGVAPSGLGKYDAGLQARLRALVAGDEATVASAAFLADAPAPAYRDAVAKAYEATVERLTGLKQVNGWANARTKGRIPTLLDKLPGNVSMVLLNAVTFDGLWATPFSPNNTRKEAFHAPEGDRTVDTMHLKGARLAYAKGAGYQVVAMPYEGGRYRMLILLPDAGGDPASLLKEALQAPAKEETVDLALPRFSVRSSPDVEGALKAMGLAPLFKKVDFRPGVPNGSVAQLSAVVQKTMIEVGEKGTKAAAATAIVGVRAIMRPVQAISFRVDRPFAFVLQHVGTGEPLFEGVIREP